MVIGFGAFFSVGTMWSLFGKLAMFLALISSELANAIPVHKPSRLAVDPTHIFVTPKSYSVTYNYTLPYTARIQPDAISYPVKFYRDAEAGRVRMDTFDGTNVMIAKKVRAQGGWSIACVHL
jgi:hypothetical protein